MEQLSYTKQLLMQLNLQRSEGHLCDMVIMVENVLFRAHKNVLAACSGYFKCLVLRDNLITLSTQVVKPSVFQQVLDFIYTGQLSASHCSTDQGVCELLRAASYLQLSDLVALCLWKLKPCWSDHWSWSSLSTNGHLQVSYSCLPGPTEVEKSHKDQVQRVDLSKEGRVAVNSSTTGGTASSLQQNSPQPNLDFCNRRLERRDQRSDRRDQRLEHRDQRSDRRDQRLDPGDQRLDCRDQRLDPGDQRLDCRDQRLDRGDQRLDRGENPRPGSQQTSHKRPQSSRDDCLEGTKRHGELIQADWMESSELEDHAETPEEEGLDLKTKLQVSEEGRSEDKERVGYVHHQPALCMCITCGESFPNSEQLVAHVDTHSAGELRVKDEDGNFVKTEGQGSKDPPSRDEEDRTTSLRPQLFACDVCGRPFTQRGTMMRHRRSHLGLKPYACEECGLRFTRQYRKIEHMRIHTGEKPYECPICDRKFTQRQSVLNHLKMHTRVS